MEMKLTFAPFVFSPRGRKLPKPFQISRIAPFGNGTLTKASLLSAGEVDLSRMSLSSLLYHALIGDGTASH